MNSEKVNLLTSLKRTLIPILVGAIAASFLGKYIDSTTANNFLSGLISAVYYTVLRVVETKWPEAGVLLGAKYQPVYTLDEEVDE